MTGRDSIRLDWLGHEPQLSTGSTWGVPWKEGVLNREETLTLHSADGAAIPMQSWPTAYWPDGSVKWTAHATSIEHNRSSPYYLERGMAAMTGKTLTVEETEQMIIVNNGDILYNIGRTGPTIIQTIEQKGRQVCAGAKLICIREEYSETSGYKISKEEIFQSEIDQAIVEQEGPVRAVVRLKGRHQLKSGERAWLPFQLRIYFYVGQTSFNLVHTFVFDGNPHKDFIKGLGITFDMPMRGALYNRHIRFAGDTGIFSESPKNLMTTRTQGKYQQLYQHQVKGEQLAFDSEEDARFLDLLDDAAVWNHFKLVQDSADHYIIEKRTKDACSWLKAAEGRRAGGLIYAGCETGGLAIGMKNFWEKHPASLEVEHISKDHAQMTAWFWSPDSRPMDLRHYDTDTHLASSYEGFEEMRSTPYGIANTNELKIWCLEKTPDYSTIDKMAAESRSPALLRCEPQYYHQAKAFGVWSLPVRSTQAKTWIETQLDTTFQFYQNEVEQRRWYGFWDYGDFMHSYDPVRHTWRYDIGGFAWQNTELVPNMWLWYMYLRTGREDVFRLAEAMTRHTSEVDVYHLGEYAGLGSRHNVVHWGCGCKEARISMAGLHRFYYYLTGDERIGDIMDEVKDSDFTTVQLDPMRAYFPKDEFPTHARVGPDWAAFTSNWLTRWERYEDTNYRDKIKTGIETLKKMPHRMTPLATNGYDPKTGELFYMGKDSGGHLAICMGGPQIWIEMAQMLKDPSWEEMLAEIGAFYNLPSEEKRERTKGAITGRGYGHPMFSTGITAFAAVHKKDQSLAKLAWRILLNEPGIGLNPITEEIKELNDAAYIRPIHEIPWISTNVASQWALNAIFCLDLIGDQLPETVEEARKQQTNL